MDVFWEAYKIKPVLKYFFMVLGLLVASKTLKKKTRMMGILIKYLCHYLPRHG
jgi:hypothetical protein